MRQKRSESAYDSINFRSARFSPSSSTECATFGLRGASLRSFDLVVRFPSIYIVTQWRTNVFGVISFMLI